MQSKLPVAILGATGTVGQKAIAMVEAHPHFYVAELAASDRSAGKKYSEACQWREPLAFPERLASSVVKNLKDIESPLAISALPADIAREIEPFLAEKGINVFSNASAFRLNEQIPLLIPEVNSEHLKLTEQQQTKGKIITNPNCSTVFLTMGLAPLFQLSKINHISVVTLQALSGAGYPGVSSFDLLGNIIPNIGGEEAKIEKEVLKLLGTPAEWANIDITVHVNRVPVVHGHTIATHVFFEDKVSVDQVLAAFQAHAEKYPGIYKIHHDEFSPQPARELTHDDQRVHIGRIKQGGSANVIGFVAMGHNLVRGAAGAALKNMEAYLNYTGQINE